MCMLMTKSMTSWKAESNGKTGAVQSASTCCTERGEEEEEGEEEQEDEEEEELILHHTAGFNMSDLVKKKTCCTSKI